MVCISDVLGQYADLSKTFGGNSDYHTAIYILVEQCFLMNSKAQKFL